VYLCRVLKISIMTKVIKVLESAQVKIDSKTLIGLTNKVKAKRGAIGTEGVLKDNILYRIIKGGFIIF